MFDTRMAFQEEEKNNNEKTTMIFGRLASTAALFAKFHAGTKKSPSGFWPPLPEQQIKCLK